jgi:hypothetical protein
MTVHQSVNPENLGSPLTPRIAPDLSPVATEAGSRTPDQAEAGARRDPASPFPQSWYRPRFLVLPTGRTILQWGVFDTKDGKPLPTGIPKTSDFVTRCRTLGKAMAFARRLNEKHERRAA